MSHAILSDATDFIVNSFEDEVGARRLMAAYLRRFVAEHQPQGRPILAMQCAPIGQVTITRVHAKSAIRDGAGNDHDSIWWGGWASTSISTRVDAEAGGDLSEPSNWATEVHLNGLVQAGVWQFPTVQAPGATSSVLALPAFFATCFEDFGALVSSVLSSAAERPSLVLLHALLVNPEKGMRFLQDERASRMGRVVPTPLLQWPVLKTDLHGLSDASKEMADSLRRICDAR